MSPIEFAILGLYFLTLVVLAVFGFHRYIMVFLYFRHRDRRARPLPLPARLPRVTVQLPLYNEMYVVERLVDSVCRIRYPKELLEIQVLDDSDGRDAARSPRPPSSATASKGFDIHYVHRGRPPRLQGGRAGGRPRARPRASSSSSSTRTSWPPPDILEKSLGALRRPQGRHGAGALGPHQPRLLAAHPGAVDPARRALHHRARRAQPLGPLLQLQRHRGRLAPRRHRGRGRLAARHADRGPRPLATARS